MLLSKSNLAAALSVAYSIAFALCAMAESFAVGDRVEADPLQIGKYKLGTVVSVEAGGLYRVRFDDDRPGYDGMLCKEAKMRKSTAAPPAVQGATTGQRATTGQGVNTVQSATTKNTQPSLAPTKLLPQKMPTVHDEGSAFPAGKGAPPSGTYKCTIMSSSLQNLPTLEITGGTYRGLGQSMTPAPYTVNGSEITWSQGIRGLPDGATIRKSMFVGPDYRGRPMIRIYYRSRNGFNQCIECVKSQ